MAQISRSTKVNGTTSLAASTRARAVDIETDMAALFSAWNNHDTGTSAWTVVKATGSSSVPLVINNSTGTQNIFEMQDNGTVVFKLADGGTLTCSPGGTDKVVLNSSGITLSNSATLAAGGAKITGLGAATAAGDGIRYEQVFLEGSYTPTFSAGFGTVASPNIRYRVIGPEMRIWGHFTTGTVAASAGTITLPSGYAINTSKIANNEKGFLGLSFRFPVTGATLFSGDRAAVFMVGSGVSNPTVMYHSHRNASGSFDLGNASSWFGSSEVVYFDVSFPWVAV